jgi:hypothetical protein
MLTVRLACEDDHIAAQAKLRILPGKASTDIRIFH